MDRVKKDVVIIGGGPAGLAAAIKLHECGVRDLVILEREKQLGGILRQCIHDGFGLTRFGKSLSGPEYAARFIREAEARGILYEAGTFVTSLNKQKEVTAVSPRGMKIYEAEAVVLAMGCRERTRGALAIPGERPAGVFTAGVAQSYINLYNKMPGKRVAILGSGDIGLIMARRLTLEGAEVIGVFEVMPHANGLPRNLRQCLYDYGIPLHLNHTVTDIHGNSRLRGITVSEVDANRNPVSGSETFYDCDTLILSVGLIPENELSLEAGVILDPATKGAVVDQDFMTVVPGIFAAGNTLQVHDLVDFVSMEAEKMALSIEKYLQEEQSHLGVPEKITVTAGNGVSYVLPQKIDPDRIKRNGVDTLEFSLRVKLPVTDCKMQIVQSDEILGDYRFAKAIPAEMIKLRVDCSKLSRQGDLEVRIC